MANDTVSVDFTKEELWLLQKFVRHEITGQSQWEDPPASLELNDQISHAILLCEDFGQHEASLQLSKKHLLVIDFVVPQDAKSVSGIPVGREILKKSFRARRELDGPILSVEEEHHIEKEIVKSRLFRMEQAPPAGPDIPPYEVEKVFGFTDSLRRKKRARSSNNPRNDADDQPV